MSVDSPSARSSDASAAAPDVNGLPLRVSGVVAFALITLSVLAAQVVLTRLFASVMTYYFAFMVVSLALLGLGAGGLVVQLLPSYFRRERLLGQAARYSLAMGISATLGTLALLSIYRFVPADVAIRPSAAEFWSLGALFWCLLPMFFFGGLVVSLVLGHAGTRFHHLYAVDLVSAAVGCVLAVWWLGVNPPAETMLTAVACLPSAAGALFAMAERHVRTAGVALLVALLQLGSARTLAASPRFSDPPHVAALDRPIVLSRSNAFSSVRVHPVSFLTWALSPTYEGPAFEQLTLLIDGVGGTRIVAFDGRAESLSRYDYLDADLTALGQRLVGAERRQLIIGPGGGVDILQAVRSGRSSITTVEINPLVVEVVNDDLASFSGRPYDLPGVETVIANGRTFLERTSHRWDLISLTWVDFGGSATALALSENYLYTIEAFASYLRHLTNHGYLAFLRALGAGEPLRVDSLRGVAVAVEALTDVGIAEPSRHLVIAGAVSRWHPRPMCYVLVKRTPFAPEEVAEVRAFVEELGFEPIWLPDGTVDPRALHKPFSQFGPLIHAIVTVTDRAALYREAPLDIAPSTDDNPFYFVERGGKRRAAGVGIVQLRTLLLVLLVLVVPFLLLPVSRRLRGSARPTLAGAVVIVYFALIGTGFMMIEIEFFHVFSMLLGHPTTTFAVVLASLLVFSGLGSLVAKRLAAASTVAQASAFLMLALLLCGFLLARTWLFEHLVPLSLPLRVLGTVSLIAPIGFVLGLPMATAMSLIASRRDLVLWGWALNGAFSVLASVAAVYAAIHLGIATTFGFGVGCYLLAGMAFLYFRRRLASLEADSSLTTA